MSRDVWGTYITDDDYKNALQLGICKATIYSRIGRGMKAKDAISIPVRGKRSNEYKEALKKATRNGIKPDTFRFRVDNSGWTLERAATTPAMSQKEILNKARKSRRRLISDSVRKLARSNGICYATLYDRIRCGMSAEKAATSPLVKGRLHPFSQKFIIPKRPNVKYFPKWNR